VLLTRVTHPLNYLDHFDSVEIGNININMADSRRNTHEGGASPASYPNGDIEMNDLSLKKVKNGYELDSVASTEVSRPPSQQVFVNPQAAAPAEKTWMQRLCPCFTLEFFAQYFDVTS
jgi:hypothetical protein